MNEDNNKKDIEALAREMKREYFRKWRAANKDKVKENNRRYWEKKALKKRRQNNGYSPHENDSGVCNNAQGA